MAATSPIDVWDVAAELGEGPVWDGRDEALWFVDIKKRQIHRFDPKSGDKRSWTAPQQIGFIMPARRGGFVAGLQSGLHHFDPDTGHFTLIVEVEPDLPGNRLNDAVVDPLGRLWFGTMDDGEAAKSGAVYCFADEQLTRTTLDGITITNGPAVSPDGETLYIVDTLKGTIDAMRIAKDGSLGQLRPFVKIDPAEGFPDGPTIDCEGYVWISLYAGWEARRYSPDGKLVETVPFPVANITKIAFGGAGLRTAFATTARQMLSAEVIAGQPQIGDLFQFQVDTQGVPCPLVRY